MPELSTLTCAKLIGQLDSISSAAGCHSQDQQNDFWTAHLFGWGFPRWFRDAAQQLDFKWPSIIPALFERTLAVDEFASGGSLRDQLFVSV
jgi:hypothetical protein